MSAHKVFLFVLLLCVPSIAVAQALPNLASTRLAYNVRKRTVNPQGELKAKIADIDRQLATATRLGQIGEVRRLLAKGMTLLAGNPWTDVLDFRNSLTLRSDKVFVDSSKPYMVRLEQIYSPAIQLERPIMAHAALRKLPTNGARPGARGATATQGETVRDYGVVEEVSRDLRESPCFIDVDLDGVKDGAYQVDVEVLDGMRLLGSASVRIVAYKGLAAALDRLEQQARSAPAALRADIEYPLAYVRDANRGRIAIGGFDLEKELAIAESNRVSVASGKDPFAGRTGDMKRHYVLKEANEVMPYRLFVPSNYEASKSFPLVVALHGLGGTEDTMFGPNYRILEQAETRGYIVVAPFGYRVDGGYGGRAGSTPNQRQQLSERDVMQVLERVRRDYSIDENRIYLMGHSMGGIGTWNLGAKYPQIWAALAPIAGSGNPSSVETMRHIPQIVVHGDADNVVPVSGSRAMVNRMREVGSEVKYIEVPGGGHGDVAGANVPKIFDFFDAHRKSQPPSQR